MRISSAVVPTILIFSFTLAIAQFNLPVLIPAFEADFGITSAQAGMLMSVYIVSYVALQIPMGLLADRVGGFRVVAVSAAVLAIVSLLGCLADSYEALLVIRVAVGIGSSACFPVCAGLIARHLPPERSAAAFGAFGLGLPLGSVVTMLVLPVLVESEGWRVGLLATVPTALMLMLLASWVSRGEEVQTGATPLSDVTSHLRDMARAPRFWPLVAINFSGAGIYVGMVTWLPLFLVDAGGLDLQAAGLLTGVVVAMGMLSSPAGGLIAGRIGRRAVILITSVAILICTLGLVLHGTILVAVVSAVGLGWFLYFYFGAYFSMATELAGSENASVKIGFFNCMGYTGTLVPPLLIGALLDASGSYVLGFAPLAFIAALGLIVAYRIWK